MNAVADLDDLSYDLEVDGELVRRTLRTRSWEDHGWATVMIAYQERTPDQRAWKDPKLLVIRFRKIGEVWKKQSSVTLPGAHALALAAELDVLQS